jgi:methylase of polypeptide subunit release factors
MTLVQRILQTGLALAMALPVAGWSAEDKERGVGDVVYVPTPQIVVDEMLRMAKAGPRDFIIDLGSGDGRMVITAAKKFGARGFGVDLSEDLLREANANAKAEGVADRAQFFKQNLFETDLKQATIISTYLLPEMNEKLRPKILALPPGTHVVAHDYHMGDWLPDETKTLSVPEKIVGTPGISYTYMWVVPAKIAGRWQSEFKHGTGSTAVEFEFTQTYQIVGGSAKFGAQTLKLPENRLVGDQLAFTVFAKQGDAASRHEFRGTVKGDSIDGTVAVGTGAALKQYPWNAKIFARTGGAK